MTNNIFSIRFVILNAFGFYIYIPSTYSNCGCGTYGFLQPTSEYLVLQEDKKKVKGKCFEFYCTNIYVPSFKNIIYTNIYIIYISTLYIYL